MKLTGASQVEAMLRQLPSKVEREKVVVKGLMAGAELIRDAVKSNLYALGAVDTGQLANEMQIRRLADQIPGQAVVALKPSGKKLMLVRRGQKKPTAVRAIAYSHLVEGGTEHSPAKPHWRPAVDEKGQAAVNAIRDITLTGIAAEARKLGLKAK